MVYETNVKVKNTFNLPCIASHCWYPESNKELMELLQTHKHVKIIADGSNVICKPKINKLICLRKMPNSVIINKDKEYITVLFEGNANLHKLVQSSIDNKFSGLEGLYGLPGTLGAAIYGNAGSGNSTISDYLLDVMVVNREGQSRLYNKEQLKFSRRSSIIQSTGYIIVGGRFLFPNKPIDKKKLQETKNHRMRIPLCSAGGIWKNWHALKTYKDQLVGLKVGGAMISDMINVIVNDGTATYEDIMTLIKKTRSIVKEDLKLEVKVL